MTKITVLGVFAGDTTYFADRLPKPGETLLGTDFNLGPGGKGSNQSVACAKLGAQTSFITIVGEDAFAELAFQTWKQSGVTPYATQTGRSHTGAAFIYVDPSGENAIIIAPGAGRLISPEYVEENESVIASADLFITQLEQPMDAALKGLSLAKAAGVKTILNPAPAAQLPETMLSLCDYVTPNRSEAEVLSGIEIRSTDDAKAAAELLMKKGAGNVVVTLGDDGALCCEQDTYHHVPAFDAGTVVETTGAGDAFNAGFAVGIASGLAPLESVRLGCAVAAICTTRRGTAAAMPQRDEVEELLRRS